jgi:serralysin
MNGLAGRDWLQGDDGRDVLKGGRDKDRLWGGLKADLITCGKDADRILYYSAEESTADQADTVKFGKKDRFQFRSFDGDSITEGQQSLRYIGKKAFSGAAGELRFTGSGLQADTTGDGQADFVVNFTKETPWFSKANILI